MFEIRLNLAYCPYASDNTYLIYACMYARTHISHSKRWKKNKFLGFSNVLCTHAILMEISIQMRNVLVIVLDFRGCATKTQTLIAIWHYAVLRNVFSENWL